jgi:hypothetical protein
MRLTNIQVDEVSFVDKPANLRKFVIIKRDEKADEPAPEPKKEVDFLETPEAIEMLKGIAAVVDSMKPVAGK